MKNAPLLLAAALALAGCHEPFSNEDLLFLKAAPRGLRIEVPEGQMGGQALRAAQGEDGPARFYLDTRKAAEDANVGVFGLLDLVDVVVAYPPTVREDDRRIWGPFPSDERTELALVVDRVRTATVVTFTSSSAPARADEIYNYSFLGRPIGGSDEDYILLFGGRSLPQVSNRQGTGLMVVNFDGIKQLNPNEDAIGQLLVGYDTRDDATIVDIAADAMVTGAFEPDVAWHYRLEPSGAGRFVYFLRENLFDTTDARELLGVAARWMPDNRGRADVIVTEGDVPIPFYYASECWDPSFSRVFLFSNIPTPEFSPVGQVQLCGPDLQGSVFPDGGEG